MFLIVAPLSRRVRGVGGIRGRIDQLHITQTVAKKRTRQQTLIYLIKSRNTKEQKFIRRVYIRRDDST